MIDDQETIKRERLTFTRSFSAGLKYYFDNFLNLLVLGIALLFFPIFLIVDGLKTNSFPTQNILGIFFGFLIGAWVLHGLININKLIRKTGATLEINKIIFEEQFREHYAGFQFHLEGNKFHAFKPWTVKSPAKEIIVYFVNRDILINIKTFLRFGDLESPYHVLSNRIEAQEIFNRFNKRITNS
jgi:hypothetical protein